MELTPNTEEEKLLFDQLRSNCQSFVDLINKISDLALVSPKDWNEREVARLYASKNQLVETIAMQSSKLLLPTDFFDQTLKAL